jgi:hypothetical protein
MNLPCHVEGLKHEGLAYEVLLYGSFLLVSAMIGGNAVKIDTQQLAATCKTLYCNVNVETRSAGINNQETTTSIHCNIKNK